MSLALNVHSPTAAAYALPPSPAAAGPGPTSSPTAAAGPIKGNFDHYPSLSRIPLPPLNDRASPVPAGTTAAPSPETVPTDTVPTPKPVPPAIPPLNTRHVNRLDAASAAAPAPLPAPPAIPGLATRQLQRHDSTLMSSRQANRLGLTAEPVDTVQQFATNCEDSGNLESFCGKCFVRPSWAIFRMATHICGAAFTCLTGTLCGCTSLGCRTISICTDCCECDQPAKAADTTGSFAKSNFYLCLAGVDSIRTRTWNGADVLWQTIGEAVCREPCVDCCAQNCKDSYCCSNANDCINTLRNCSIKVAQCQERCLPHADHKETPATGWMKSTCMNGIKWLVGADNYFGFIQFAAARKKLQVPHRIPDAPPAASAGTLVNQNTEMQRGK